MVDKKNWDEFRKTGLILIINQILHIFGWSLVFELNKEGEITDVYPARVNFRGFDESSTTESYAKLTKYMNEESSNLLKDISKTDNGKLGDV